MVTAGLKACLCFSRNMLWAVSPSSGASCSSVTLFLPAALPCPASKELSDSPWWLLTTRPQPRLCVSSYITELLRALLGLFLPWHALVPLECVWSVWGRLVCCP